MIMNGNKVELKTIREKFRITCDRSPESLLESRALYKSKQYNNDNEESMQNG